MLLGRGDAKMSLRQKREDITHSLQKMESIAKGRKITVNCKTSISNFSVSLFRHSRVRNFWKLISGKRLSSFLEDQD